jgi:hypothetical protein
MGTAFKYASEIKKFPFPAGADQKESDIYLCEKVIRGFFSQPRRSLHEKFEW